MQQIDHSALRQSGGGSRLPAQKSQVTQKIDLIEAQGSWKDLGNRKANVAIVLRNRAGKQFSIVGKVSAGRGGSIVTVYFKRSDHDAAEVRKELAANGVDTERLSVGWITIQGNKVKTNSTGREQFTLVGTVETSARPHQVPQAAEVEQGVVAFEKTEVAVSYDNGEGPQSEIVHFGSRLPDEELGRSADDSMLAIEYAPPGGPAETMLLRNTPGGKIRSIGVPTLEVREKDGRLTKCIEFPVELQAGITPRAGAVREQKFARLWLNDEGAVVSTEWHGNEHQREHTRPKYDLKVRPVEKPKLDPATATTTPKMPDYYVWSGTGKDRVGLAISKIDDPAIAKIFTIVPSDPDQGKGMQKERFIAWGYGQPFTVTYEDTYGERNKKEKGYFKIDEEGSVIGAYFRGRHFSRDEMTAQLKAGEDAVKQAWEKARPPEKKEKKQVKTPAAGKPEEKRDPKTGRMKVDLLGDQNQ